MDVPVGKRVNWALALTLLLLLSAVAGHVWLPELVAGVQWLISEVIEPLVGIDDLVLT